MTDISGNIPAVVTPFRESGEIDLEAFAQLIEWHIERGVDGICVAGDNGESWALTYDEREKLASEASEIIDGRIRFIVGATAHHAVHMPRYANGRNPLDRFTR